MMGSRRATSLVLAAALAACSTGREDAEKGAAGLARLGSLSVTALTGVLLQDATCGFQSPAVKAAVVVTGAPGGAGSATYTVNACTLDFEAKPTSLKDCTGAETILHGKVTISATLTLAGATTGDPTNPVIAADPESLTVVISRATVANFLAEFPGAPAKLTMREGTFSATVKPRLAAESTANLCAIPTQDAAVIGLNLQRMSMKAESTDQTNFIFVPTTSISATIGKGATKENTYSGTVDLGNQVITLPPESDSPQLDTTYDRAAFEARFSCTQGLAKPVSYACGTSGAGGQAAQAVARLTVPAISAMVALADGDTTCGFASANAKAAAMQTGTTGGRGQVVYSIDRCTIELPAERVIATDCTGAQIRASGKITVSGRKLLTGVLTGEPALPVFPDTDQPASFELTEVVLEGFRSATSTSAALVQASGKLSAKVTPRVARGVSTQACTVRTQIVRVEDVKYADAVVTLEAGGAVTVSVLASDFDAQLGTWDNRSNTLAGTVNIAGENHMLPPNEGLVPGFDQAAHDASWQCDPDLLRPVSFECDRTSFVADGVARLTPTLFGTIAQLAESDRRCGFSSPAVAAAGMPAPGAMIGNVSTVTFRIATPCTINFPRQTSLGVDCNGVETYVKGAVQVTGTRTVTGFLTGDMSAPIVPVGRDPVEYTLEATGMGFEVSTTTAPLALRFIRGALSGSAKPRFGVDTSSGVCTQPTPNVEMKNLTYRGGVVQLIFQGLTFGFDIETSDIDAQVGIKDMVSNTFSGSLSTGGRRLTLPITPGQNALIPNFNAARWRAGYACRASFAEAQSEAECSFRRVLAPVIARLAVQNAGTALQLVGNDATCGFSSPNVLMATQVVGNFGGPGAFLNRVPTPANTTCTISRVMPDPIVNCLRESVVASGGFTVTATRSTSGLLMANCGNNTPCVIPGTRDAIGIGVSNMTFTNFAVAALGPGETMASRLLTFRSGTASFAAVPILGEDAMMIFSVPTPISRITNLRLRNVPAVLRLDGRTFNVRIDDTDIRAQVGVFPRGTGNSISGRITLDGEAITLAPAPLDPSYNQARFDLSYDCTPRLLRVVPTN